MASSNESASMAVFCDFENVALGVRDAKYEKFDIKRVLERLLLKGSIVVKKAYCDWERYKAFKASMHEANFELIEIPHVRQSGKNSADIRMVVDALDLCYTKAHVDTFVIVSGDSDFSPLVSKLRENAKRVIGVGVKRSTSDLFVANCDEFIFYDDLVRAQPGHDRRDARLAVTGRKAEGERPSRDDLEARRLEAIELAVDTYEALTAERGDRGKIWASALKDAIKRRRPDFNESYYGFRAFGNLLEAAQKRGLLEVGRDEKSGTYVYRRDDGDDDVAEHAEAHAPAGQGSARRFGQGRRPAAGSGHATEAGAQDAERAVASAHNEPAQAAVPAQGTAPDASRLEEGDRSADGATGKTARRPARKQSPRAARSAVQADGTAGAMVTATTDAAASSDAGLPGEKSVPAASVPPVPGEGNPQSLRTTEMPAELESPQASGSVASDGGEPGSGRPARKAARKSVRRKRTGSSGQQESTANGE